LPAKVQSFIYYFFRVPEEETPSAFAFFLNIVARFALRGNRNMIYNSGSKGSKYSTFTASKL
jgi:hypothetical protein